MTLRFPEVSSTNAQTSYSCPDISARPQQPTSGKLSTPIFTLLLGYILAVNVRLNSSSS
jgi:hypothetical protein